MSKYKLPRRKFLQDALMASMGVSTAYHSLFKLNSIRSLMADQSAPSMDYKALVCIFQPGGNDSFNMLIPGAQDAYNDYQTTRTNLAIDQEDLLPITTRSNQSFYVHPQFSGVQALFEEEKLAFIANLGTLIQPVTKMDYEDKQVPLPLGLFSHTDQISQWETAHPHRRVYNGWGGRLAELFQSMNTSQDISMNITLSGNNVFQFGQNIVEYSVSPNSSGFSIEGYESDKYLNEKRTTLINGMLNQPYEDIFKQSYVRTIKNSIEAQKEFQASISSIDAFETEFPDNSFGRSLETITRIIAARDLLGFKRQIFFVRYGGWDHHDGLIQRQNQLFPGLSQGLKAFAQGLEEIQAFSDVTTFTMSEFGRTLTSNGNGSDHAWGGNVMAMGGSVKGKEVYGTYPSLALNSSQDIGRGRLIPTLSNDQYFAELAMWFGAAGSDLPMIFPQLSNFYTPGSPQAPIGFLEL